VREGSPAEQAESGSGDRLVAVDGVPIAQAVELFWADLGLPVTRSARLCRAGARRRRRNAPRTDDRRRADGASSSCPTSIAQPAGATADRDGAHDGGARWIDPLQRFARRQRHHRGVRRGDGQAAPGSAIVLDLTDTASGGNTSVARAIMGWFVDKPTSYQMHTCPPRSARPGSPPVDRAGPAAPGKHHDGPVTVRVGRWTGSMGEGLAIGFDAIGARVEGGPMAGCSARSTTTSSSSRGW
jgi:carboxyl-terminal processing protease